MATTEKQGDFGAAIAKAYTFEGPALDLGRGVHDGQLVRRQRCGCRCRWSTATG